MEILHSTMNISVEEHREVSEISYLASITDIYWEATMTADGMGHWKPIEGLLVAQESESLMVSVTLVRRGDNPDAALRLLFEAMHEAGLVIV